MPALIAPIIPISVTAQPIPFTDFVRGRSFLTDSSVLLDSIFDALISTDHPHPTQVNA
ncbi:MAG: hypothetical protein HOG05_17215 [Bacteroidetes bacterium]|nr:hypothetical protein [Bacteroidota bacterium]